MNLQPLSPPATTPRLVTGGRRGMSSVLAMLYLMIFSALALGFYAQTNVSAQLARNEIRSYEAQLASESGLRLIKYHLSSLNVPSGPTPAKAFEELYMQLAERFEGTPNLGDAYLGYAAAVGTTPAQISIPETGYITLPDGSGFRAVVSNTSPNVTVKVTSRSADGKNVRASLLQYGRAPKPYALIGINGITMGGSAHTDSYDSSKGPYTALTARSNGSIATNGNVTLNNVVNIKGDVLYGSGKVFSSAAGVTITGRRGLVTKPLAFPSVVLPTTYDYSVASINNTSSVSTYPGGTYIVGDLLLGGTAKVTWSGPVKLYIKNSYTVKDGVIINTYLNLPSNRQLFFASTCPVANWSGSNVCVGDLYAPDTTFNVSGTVEKYGRIIAKTINHTSSGGLHYDESMPAPLGLTSFIPVPGSYLEVRP